jgi:hypothetical protein
MERICTCGHRKYKHSLYPLDRTFCKGVNAGSIINLNEDEAFKLCLCIKYEPIGNLEWLEQQVDKNLSK